MKAISFSKNEILLNISAIYFLYNKGPAQKNFQKKNEKTTPAHLIKHSLEIAKIYLECLSDVSADGNHFSKFTRAQLKSRDTDTSLDHFNICSFTMVGQHERGYFKGHSITRFPTRFLNKIK